MSAPRFCHSLNPCEDAACQCHGEFWDAAALAAARTPAMPLLGGEPLRPRTSKEVVELADAMVIARASRHARLRAAVLEAAARKDHPSPAWDD